jgi:hypothetical protein
MITGFGNFAMSGADPTPRQNYIQKKVYYGKEMWDFFVGKKLAAFYVDDTLYNLKVEFQDGSVCMLGVDADCCSQGWWHTFNNISSIMDKEIGSVTESNVKAPPSMQDDDEIYNITLTPAGGYYNCEISHRNSSNGYYGNSLTMTVGAADGNWRKITGNCGFMPKEFKPNI